VEASIGESAVLCAFRGARRVVAVKPYPLSYSILLQNLRLNGVSGAVVVVNAAVGGCDEDVRAWARPLGAKYRFEVDPRDRS